MSSDIHAGAKLRPKGTRVASKGSMAFR